MKKTLTNSYKTSTVNKLNFLKLITMEYQSKRKDKLDKKKTEDRVYNKKYVRKHETLLELQKTRQCLQRKQISSNSLESKKMKKL